MSLIPPGYGTPEAARGPDPDPAVEASLARPHLVLPGLARTRAAGPRAAGPRAAGPGAAGGAGPGEDVPALLLLHSTGGDENELVGLGRRLAPAAALLAPRGTVSEHGMTRFFRRHAVGVLDAADLAARAEGLAGFLGAAAEEFGPSFTRPVAVGFSNGANIATALLLGRPGLLRAAVLIGAMPVPVPAAGDLAGVPVLVVTGRADPLVSPAQADALVRQLHDGGAAVTRLDHDRGHTVPAHLVPEMAAFVAAVP